MRPKEEYKLNARLFQWFLHVQFWFGYLENETEKNTFSKNTKLKEVILNPNKQCARNIREGITVGLNVAALILTRPGQGEKVFILALKKIKINIQLIIL